MRIRRLELADFRNYEKAGVEFGPGLTAVWRQNGQGKSNLVEAVAYLATRESWSGRSPGRPWCGTAASVPLFAPRSSRATDGW